MKDKDAPEDAEEPNEPPALVVEWFDPSTNSFKFVNSVTLKKSNQKDNFSKTDEEGVNSQTLIKQAKFATNGKVLMINFFNKDKLYFFDLETGKKLKSRNMDDVWRIFAYDHSKNSMITDSTDNDFIYACSAPGCMHLDASKSREGVVSDSDAIKSFYKSLLGNSPAQATSSDKKKPNLIEGIMKKKSAQKKLVLSKNQSNLNIDDDQFAAYLKVVVLKHIQFHCEKFEVEFISRRATGPDMLHFFKYPNATYLTGELFQ